MIRSGRLRVYAVKYGYPYVSDRMPYQVAAKLPKVEYEKIQSLVKAGVYINASDFVREAIRKKLSDITFNLKNPSPSTVKQELRKYAEERDGLIWPDEAARDLGYSVLEILEALRTLEEEGKAKELKTFGGGTRHA